MRHLLKRMMELLPREADHQTNPFPSEPSAGQIYSFQTAPMSEFAQPKTGRYAALKVIGVTERLVAIAVLDGIWSEAPTFRQAKSTSILNEMRFNPKEMPEEYANRPAIFGMSRDWWQPEEDLQEPAFLGTGPISSQERKSSNSIINYEVGSQFSALNFVNYAAEGEWRWSNDRDALIAEGALSRERYDAERAAKEERYRNRLSKLSWDQLRTELPFANWSPSPPFPPEEFTREAREMIRGACSALEALGPKPRKSDVRVILKQTVLWFNQADEAAAHVIETEEREDICAVLEELAFVARHKSLVDEIDEWRDW